MTRDTKKRIAKSTDRPIGRYSAYAAGTWMMRKEHVRRIESFEMKYMEKYGED